MLVTKKRRIKKLGGYKIDIVSLSRNADCLSREMMGENVRAGWCRQVRRVDLSVPRVMLLLGRLVGSNKKD